MFIIFPFLIGLFVMCLLVLASYGVHYFANGIRALLRPDRTPDFGPLTEFPLVTVQIPVCNEGEMVEGAIRSALALEYPPDRIQFQICDDSTDTKTTEICHRLATDFRGKGYNVEHLRRKERAGFKPGNLNHAMQTASGEFVVILDADFWIPRDFLHKNLPILLRDPQVAVVQSHWIHSNRDESAFHQAAETSYEMHLLVEQLTRSNWDLWMEFNGSGGIIRRAALDDIGGWPLGTAVEDVYMSFLVQPRGWKIRFSTATTCVGRLPSTMESYRRQRTRWPLGCGEIFRHQIGAMWRAPVSWAAKQQGIFHLGGNLIHVAMTGIMLLTWPIVWWIAHNPSYTWVQWFALACFLVLFLGGALMGSEANRRMGRKTVGIDLSSIFSGFEQTGMAPMAGTRFLMGLWGKRIDTWVSSNSRSGRGSHFIPDMIFESLLFLLALGGVWDGFRSGLYFIPAINLYLSAGLAFWLLAPLMIRRHRTAESTVPATHPETTYTKSI